MNVACKGRVRDLTWRLNIVQIFLALIVKTSWFHLLQPLGRLKWYEIHVELRETQR